MPVLLFVSSASLKFFNTLKMFVSEIKTLSPEIPASSFVPLSTNMEDTSFEPLKVTL